MLKLHVDPDAEVEAFAVFVFFEGVLVVLGFEAGFIAEGEAEVRRQEDFGFVVGSQVDAASHAEGVGGPAEALGAAVAVYGPCFAAPLQERPPVEAAAGGVGDGEARVREGDFPGGCCLPVEAEEGYDESVDVLRDVGKAGSEGEADVDSGGVGSISADVDIAEGPYVEVRRDFRGNADDELSGAADLACCGEVGQDGVEFRFVEYLVTFAVEPCEAYGGLGVEAPASEARLGGIDEGQGDDGVGDGEVSVAVFQVHGTKVFEIEFIGDEVGFGRRCGFARECVRIAGRLHVAGID